MAETIPGGAFQDAAGAWHNANGEPLAPEQIAEAERLLAERAKVLAHQEAVTSARAIQGDPATLAALRAVNMFQQPQPTPVREPQQAPQQEPTLPVANAAPHEPPAPQVPRRGREG
ncbi:MAG: hypothetical protein H7Y32_12850 [Chloroflexales bacterium]|nr:hypothetical protein [Chloroflexales bacterium]